MKAEEIMKINDRIIQIIGERPRTDRTATPEEMNLKRQWDRTHDELWKLVEEYGLEVITGEAVITYGSSRAEGYTPKGKKVIWYRNHGYTRRSLYCGTLIIDGVKIFTSGTLAKCFEYIHTH